MAKTDYFNPLWEWNKKKRKKMNNGKQFPVTKFIQENYSKVEEIVMGPGGGIGIGCGIGAGFGLVGGVGYGGWPWNHLKLVFGAGVGCGIGVGFGYGHGLGHGFSMDSFGSFMPKRRSDSKNKSIIFQI